MKKFEKDKTGLSDQEIQPEEFTLKMEENPMNEVIEEQVTEKNTKSDILAAYQRLLNEIKSQKKVQRKDEVEKEKQQKLVNQSKEYEPSKILQNLASLKFDLSQYVEMINNQLLEECKKLDVLTQAIAVEEGRLKERYDINVQADTLAALLLAQEREKEEFQKDMNQSRERLKEEIKEAREKWEKEQATFEEEREAKQQQSQKERKREEEEYRYKQNLERQKEKDQYEQKKALLERELEEKRILAEKALTEREAAITQREKAMDALQTQVDQFAEQLEKAVTEAEKRAVEKIMLEHRYATELREKEFVGETQLLRQKIESNEKKIHEMEGQIERLNQKADQANQQVQTIAVRAIEGASNLSNMGKVVKREEEKV